MYVWFDALTNYISAIDYADEGERYARYWLENPHRVHALGKGVIRFHAIYWPAMLLSAGIPLPEAEFVHGYINIAGAKMSKSLGNGALVSNVFFKSQPTGPAPNGPGVVAPPDGSSPQTGEPPRVRAKNPPRPSRHWASSPS